MDENQVVFWLLESKIPTIRYRTLLELRELPHDHPACLSEYQMVQASGAVPSILNQQVEPGRWKYPNHYYTPKYTSTHWSMMLLEELYCDSDEPRFQAGVDFMLSSTKENVEKYKNTGWSCLWGNIVRYCLHGNRSNDHRLQNMIELTADSLLNKRCACDWNWQMACVWGVARSIWGLIKIPQGDRSTLINEAIRTGMDFVLENCNLIISNQGLEVEKQTHPIWHKLNFPLFYQSDILFVLRLLYEIDELNHPLAKNLLVWLKSKQKQNGRWQGSSPFRQRTYSEIGSAEETSRWVTLQASTILKKAGFDA